MREAGSNKQKEEEGKTEGIGRGSKRSVAFLWLLLLKSGEEQVISTGLKVLTMR